MSGLFNDDTLSLYLKLKEAMKQYVRDAFGGSLNPEVPNYPGLLAAQAKAQQNTLRDAWGDPNKMADATLGMMNGAMGSFLPFGITAWHGSPHKFDKFSLDKIGTGEGAQAYGHGLYLAESPEVARDYQKVLSGPRNQIAKGQGKYFHITDAGSGEVTIAGYGSSQDQWGRSSNLSDFWDGSDEGFKSVDDAVAWLRNNKHIDETATPNKVSNAEFNEWQIPSSGGSLYKTDIPDEAVARFLDWDKPLSEQAKEVQAALKSMTDDVTNGGFDLSRSPRNVARAFDDSSVDEAFKVLQQKYGVTNSGGQYFDKNGNPITDNSVQRHINKIAGKGYDNAGQLYSDLMHIVGSQSDISATLKNNGIPGIRYLDGGSRGAGTGTSNFVVFDPEMIRILERNGEATGAKPWQPGEWEGLFKK